MINVIDLKVGDTFPQFTALVHNGSEFDLSDLKGKQALVLFFYPKANTGG